MWHWTCNKKILNKVGKNGEVYGIDSSIAALKIAKKWVGDKKNILKEQNTNNEQF